eukprot:Nk52_evm1s840 gene=Nk52_evmTU1s840
MSSASPSYTAVPYYDGSCAATSTGRVALTSANYPYMVNAPPYMVNTGSVSPREVPTSTHQFVEHSSAPLRPSIASAQSNSHSVIEETIDRLKNRSLTAAFASASMSRRQLSFTPDLPIPL